MKFDESGVVKGARRKQAKAAGVALEGAQNLLDLAARWIVTPEREITLCNGIDGHNHFDSLCIILKDSGRHIAERYLALNSIKAAPLAVTPVSAYVNWNQYFKSEPTSHPMQIAEYFNAERFERSVGIENHSVDPYFNLPVVSPKVGLNAAIAHALAPFSEATLSGFDFNFFEGDALELRKWQERQLVWLFTSLRPPHPVNGMFPEFIESMIIDFSAKPLRKSSLASDPKLLH